MDHWIALDRLTDVLVGYNSLDRMRFTIKKFKDADGNTLEVNISQKNAELTIGAIKYTDFDKITATVDFGAKPINIDPWEKLLSLKDQLGDPLGKIGLVVEESEDALNFYKRATLTIDIPGYGNSIFTFLTLKPGVRA